MRGEHGADDLGTEMIGIIDEPSAVKKGEKHLVPSFNIVVVSASRGAVSCW